MRRPIARLLAVLVTTLAAAAASAQAPGAPRERPAPATPTHADVRYGPHERNVLDLYLAASDRPTPLVLFFHGGGFRSGDKRQLRERDLRSYLAEGWSVASVNYRLTDVAPAPAQYLDCARALQFLRHHAAQWNLDPKRVAATGSSAGGGTALWIAFHDDLADAKSDDPVARESTRVTAVAVKNAQTSYDPRFAERIGIPRPNFERHPFFEPFFGISAAEIDTPEAQRRYERYAPITYLSADDPPVLMIYGRPDADVTAQSPLGLVVHHPRFGIDLERRMDALGIECIVEYRDARTHEPVRRGGGPVVDVAGFLRERFRAAP